jgi:pyridoxamine 5'-phosphate oxidase
MDKLKLHIRILRKQFSAGLLTEKDVSRSPWKQFQIWLMQAIDANVLDPNAMTIATASSNGTVDARIVLLRDFDTKGLTFFTNYNSIKGREIRQNKKVCINFYWPELQRQIRIRGLIEKVSSTVSDRYFASRPRDSQLAAWASHQSEKLLDRDELENRYVAYKAEFKSGKVPRPSHWGGYRVKPIYFEFWQGRENRLHDRIIFQKSNSGKWVIMRLNP